MEVNIGARRSRLTARTPPQQMRELLKKTPDVTSEVAKIGGKRRNRNKANKSNQGKEESKRLEDLKKGSRRERRADERTI